MGNYNALLKNQLLKFVTLYRKQKYDRVKDRQSVFFICRLLAIELITADRVYMRQKVNGCTTIFQNWNKVVHP